LGAEVRRDISPSFLVLTTRNRAPALAALWRGVFANTARLVIARTPSASREAGKSSAKKIVTIAPNVPRPGGFLIVTAWAI